MSNQDNTPNTADSATMQRTNRTLLVTMAIVIFAAVVIAILGFALLNKPAEIIEGQAEGTTVRISGKLPGRVYEFYVHEGDTVHAGDTLVHIHSSMVEAQLMQAEALHRVASTQDQKVDAGTRKQIVDAAADMVRQAEAAVSITRKTYDRLQTLYSEGVVTEQKRDEAKAAYDAAVAQRDAAQSQLALAKAGAQKEDKESAAALVQAASGGVDQVKAVLDDSYLLAPCDGTIDEIYPEVGELVATGAPIMSLLRTDDRWVTFNVREELLPDFKQGSEFNVMVPGMGDKDMTLRVYYVRDRGSYAVWHSTKATGSWDSRTFEIKARPVDNQPDLRPGMSVIYKK